MMPLSPSAPSVRYVDIPLGVVRAIATACLQAPSGDNCQPWHFVWDGKSLAVHHNAQRARHPINRGWYGSLLTLGCVVESAVIAATTYGLRAHVHLGEFREHGAEPWARIRFTTDATTPVNPLAAAIDRRCTDRRLYLGGCIDAAGAAALEGDRLGAARVALVTSPTDETIDYAQRAESSLMSDPHAFAAVMEWVRFSRHEAELRRDGMHLANLGVRWFERPVLRLLRACPWLVGPLAACGSARLQQGLVKRQIRSSAALLCIAVSNASQQAVVEAGRVAMRAWLRLTAAGFAVQPLSLSSLNAYLASTGGLIEPARAAFFRDGRGVLARAFQLGDSELPIWMFRTGRSAPLPPTLRTLRRPLDEVFADISDAA